MMDQTDDVDLGFTAERLPDSCHVCLIFESEDQRREIVSAYLAAGLRQGEATRYATDTTAPDTIRSWLLDLGVEPPSADAFAIVEAMRFYCPEGQFQPERAISRMAPRYDADRRSGYTGTRTTAEMSWALRGVPGSDRLLEYEALINTVKHEHRHGGMCQYDARRFNGAALFKVLQVHPYMIAQGRVVRNPSYVRPEEVLASLGPARA